MAPKKKMPNEDNDCGGRDGSRAMWSKENLYLFCDLCIEFAERSKGKRGSTISQRMPWKVLEVEFQKRTNLASDKNKLKNKWDWMRSRWSLWKALKGKETGLGWDHEKGIISASEEWWQMKIEENTQFRSFQEEGIEPELEYKMEQLFGVSVAQGALRLTPGQREKESMYIPTPLENAPYDYDDDMSENDILNHNQAS
ncbi:L10-interacting MYB domain-containing protein [Bienertia sinuspersici]